MLLNFPLLKLWGLESIHNTYNVPSEPERAAKARRAVVASNKAKALLAGWLFPQKNECACSSLKKAFEAYLEMTKTLIFPLMKL